MVVFLLVSEHSCKQWKVRLLPKPDVLKDVGKKSHYKIFTYIVRAVVLNSK